MPRSPSLNIGIYYAARCSPSLGGGDVTSFILEFEPGTAEWIDDVDWDAISQTAASFPNMEVIRIYVRTKPGPRRFRRLKLPAIGPLGPLSRDWRDKLEILVQVEDV